MLGACNCILQAPPQSPGTPSQCISRERGRMAAIRCHSDAHYQNIMIGQFQLHSFSSLPRTFVFDHELELTSHSLEFAIENNVQNVNVAPVLKIFQEQRGRHEHYLYRIFDPTISQYVELPEDQQLPQHFFMTPIIMVKYRKVVAESDSESSSSIVSNDSRKERNKERTIREVIESVKRWRDLHNGSARDKNKVSLQEAAKLIGISKKSLDDYYYQLRLGEQHNFNFEEHLDSKIGVLRAFVRKHKPVKETHIGGERHPKQLRIIEALGLEPVRHIETEEVTPERHSSPEAAVSDMTVEEPREEKPIPYLDFNQPKVQEQSELRYYDNFMFDSGPSDPFVPYREMDFKKKQQGFPDEFDMMPW